MGQWSDEYPRPLFRRNSFIPLCSGWRLNDQPINVPWPPEAELSGFRGEIGNELTYSCSFSLPEGFAGESDRVVLHLGAVDQTCEVQVNGHLAVRHEGGYMPFSADITELLSCGDNSLTVLARDSLSTDYPYGKQSKEPHGMWYTQVSGIWQTVWLEAVPRQDEIRGLAVTADLEKVTIDVDTDAAQVSMEIPEAGIRAVTSSGALTLRIPSPRLWCPEDPFLYTLAVDTGADRVESYFAMRSVSVDMYGGFSRFLLNGKPVYLHGVLDQGYFRDGIFLPRDPEEYERDIIRMRDLGFNTLRKHVKVEPETFYYACDRLGMLVLQDMVSSGEYSYLRDTVLPTLGFKKRSDVGAGGSKIRREIFVRQVKETLERLRPHPCVVGYTIFNEGWGQFDSDRLYSLCKRLDPSRFYVSASGWFAQKKSDVQSEHMYFKSRVLTATRPGQVLLLSEFGGLSRRVPGHVDESRRNYGYGKKQATEASLTAGIRRIYDESVIPSLKNGLCGSIYTQLSDVEGETNGLYTYDREVLKVDREQMRELADVLFAEFRIQL